MPIVLRVVPGVDCCGCTIAAVEDRTVELRCNDFGAVVGTAAENGLLIDHASARHLRPRQPISLLRSLDVNLGL
jgi:hypothetical protein